MKKLLQIASIYQHLMRRSRSRLSAKSHKQKTDRRMKKCSECRSGKLLMLLMASKSLFNDTLRIHHSRWPSSSEVPELRLNPIICMTALRAHREISWLFLPTSQNCEVDKMTLCGKKHECCVCTLLHLVNVNVGFSVLCTLQLTCTGDRVYSGLSCHLSSSSETRGSKNINCGQRIEWKKQVRDKNVSLADGKRPQEKQSVNLIELERLLFCLF